MKVTINPGMAEIELEAPEGYVFITEEELDTQVLPVGTKTFCRSFPTNGWLYSVREGQLADKRDRTNIIYAKPIIVNDR